MHPLAFWKPIDHLSTEEWAQVRLTAHWALQIPAALAHQCLKVAPDYSHSAMTWSPELGALLTGITQGVSPVRAGLRLRDLTVLVVDGRGRIVAERALSGLTMEAGFEWLSSTLRKNCGSSFPSLTRPNLTLPKSPIESGEPFPALESAHLRVLEAWYHNADLILRHQPGALPGKPPVRIWPHHFDAAALYVLDPDADPENARSLGLGFSPGDENFPDPYWYVLPWPKPEISALPSLVVGRWELTHYIGGHLQARELDEVQAFYREAVTLLHTMLVRSAARARLQWYKAVGLEELPEGRAKSVSCGRKTVCLTHINGQYGALDNRCPHQGGPLGDGTIEKGVLRCPWHGWDYDPITGRSVGPYDDGVETFSVEVRDDGVYVGIEDPRPHQQTVSDVMAETMTNWGVEAVFGMVGHSNLGLADALRRQAEAGRLRYFGIRHEGAAAFAASAYGKLTGRPAACLSIAGPGATNLLTGLWDANVDRAPVLALTGQVDTQVLGPGAFQEIDLKAAYGGVAQWSQVVLSTSKHAELMNLAVRTAVLNRGVSHLIFPDEVQTQSLAPETHPGSPDGRLPDLSIRPSEDSLNAAAEKIREAKRPAFIVGHGATRHMDGILSLAEQLGAPILTTFKGKGLVPDDHSLGCGVLGRSGTPIASWFMNEADLLVVFGASFSNHTGITSYKPTIQVDYEATQLARFHPITVPVLGEINTTVGLLAQKLEGQTACLDHRPEIEERWKLWRAEKDSRAKDDSGHGISAAAVFSTLSQHTPKNAIICVDVGNNTYAFGRYFEATGQKILMSGYLGSIGFALPAAMGAWVATTENNSHYQGQKVVSVSGDGGLAQYLAEVTTLVKYAMNITHVVLNNHQLGKISKEQRSGEWPVWETGLVNPDFAAFARNCGAHGVRVTQIAELDSALQEAMSHEGPSLVEIVTDADLV